VKRFEDFTGTEGKHEPEHGGGEKKAAENGRSKFLGEGRGRDGKRAKELTTAPDRFRRAGKLRVN